MNKVLSILLLTLTVFTISVAQKRNTIMGDAWVGEIVAVDETTRKITIEYPDKDKRERFTAVLKDGYKLNMSDGSSQELKISVLPKGMRVRLFASKQEESVNGQKHKFYRIFRIDFLGKDEFAWLRGALKVDPELSVKLSESEKLPTFRPLKLFVAIEHEGLRQRFVNWTAKWNKEHAEKYGALHIVSTVETADAALVVLKGGPNIIMTPSFITSDNQLVKLPPVSAYLVVLKENELDVLWRQTLLMRETTGPETEKGRIEKEVEKRLKDRH